MSYTCTCSAGEIGGAVLLFYRYWNNTPPLPDRHGEKAAQLEGLAEWHSGLMLELGLRGKVRIAKEGFNVTVAGTSLGVDTYMKECSGHWSFDGLDLGTDQGRRSFFKPTEGCACVFEDASVRVCAEITPMGIEGYAPNDWAGVVALSPEEFHRRCYEEKVMLLDVRNHYESRIGYFVYPETGVPAHRPPIRRFSQWPQYLKHHKDLIQADGHRQIMTYCTGGIRCEKGVRWMQENLAQHSEGKIYTLSGGIAAYLTWMDEEIQRGRKQANESLFWGRNYVFDARGSTGSKWPTKPVSRCHICSEPTDNMSKCRSDGCHLVLVICSICGKGDPRCCQSCYNLSDDQLLRGTDDKGPRPICACEQAREEQLWGGKRGKLPKTQGWRTEKRKLLEREENINIQVSTLEG